MYCQGEDNKCRNIAGLRMYFYCSLSVFSVKEFLSHFCGRIPLGGIDKTLSSKKSTSLRKVAYQSGVVEYSRKSNVKVYCIYLSSKTILFENSLNIADRGSLFLHPMAQGYPLIQQ